MDKKQGKGSYIWADGRKYVGGWLNGRQHGEGMYVAQDGVAKKGLWEHGKRSKWLNSSDNLDPNRLASSRSPSHTQDSKED